MICFRKAPSAPVVILNLSKQRVKLFNNDIVQLDPNDLSDEDFDQIAKATERGLIINASPPLPPIKEEDVIAAVNAPYENPLGEKAKEYLESARRIFTPSTNHAGIGAVEMTPEEIANNAEIAQPVNNSQDLTMQGILFPPGEGVSIP